MSYHCCGESAAARRLAHIVRLYRKGRLLMADAVEVWRGFWSTAAGISATLLGLLFVAMALNAKQVIANAKPQLLALTYRAMTAYATVALLGLLIQMPMFSPKRLGALIAFIGLVLVLGLTWRIARGANAFSSTILCRVGRLSDCLVCRNQGCAWSRSVH